MERRIALSAGLAALAGCAAAPPAPRRSRAELVTEVTTMELGFAKTMADRDFAAFMRFVADDAIFLNGGQPLRGRVAVGDHWRRYFEPRSAPFSWKPELVEVIDSGQLAQSIGPVMAPDGKVIARFYSTWRYDTDGRWRVVFDDGYTLPDCPKA